MQPPDKDAPDYQKLLDHDGATVRLCDRCEAVVCGKGASSRSLVYVIAALFAVCEFALIILAIAGGKSVWQSYRIATQLDGNEYPMDYWSLEDQNITAKSFRIHNAADKTPEAEQFWHELLKDVGIVSIHAQWAADNGLPPSLQHPDDDDHYVYQVGAYHTFHCLEHVRDVLTSTDSAQPRNDRHTLHCLDHIRERLMCHPDISFQGTIDYVQWDVQPDGHRCRDLDALQSWTHNHLWADYAAFYAAQRFPEMNANFTRQLRADQEAYPDVPWDHVETITDEGAGPGGEDIYRFVHHDERVFSAGEKFQKLWIEQMHSGST